MVGFTAQNHDGLGVVVKKRLLKKALHLAKRMGIIGIVIIPWLPPVACGDPDNTGTSVVVRATLQLLIFFVVGVTGDRLAALDVFEVFLDFAAFGGSDVVDVEAAVKVVNFVQDGAAEETAGVEGEGAAFHGAGDDADARGAGDIEGEAGEAEAAFVADDLAFGRLEDGIDEDERHVVLGIDRHAVDPHFAGAFLDAGDVDHGDLDGFTDLLRGESDAARVAHGVEEVFDQGLDGGRDGADFAAFYAQNGRVVVNNFPNHGPVLAPLGVSVKVGRLGMPAT